MSDEPTDVPPQPWPRFTMECQALLPWEGRIHLESFQDLLRAIEIETNRVLADSPEFTGPLQVDLALFPHRECFIQVSAADCLSADDATKLLDAHRRPPMPVVRDVMAFYAIATTPESGAAEVYPPFESDGVRMPPELTQAFRAYEESPLHTSTAEEPHSGWGVLANLARRMLEYLRSKLESGHQQGRRVKNADPLLGHLSSEDLQQLRGLSDNELDERIKRLPDDPCCYLVRAARQAHREAHDAAIEDLNQVIRLAPDVAGAYLRRNWSFSEKQNLTLALRDANMAIELCPDQPSCYESRGGLYLRLEAWVAAEADFSRCIELDELRAAHYVWRSHARWNLPGRRAEAIDDLDQALRLDPYDFKAIGVRLSVDDQDEADDRELSQEQRIEYLERAIHFGPPHPEPLMRRAYAYLRHNEPSQALAMCEQALELDEHFLAAIAVRGLAHFALGDYEQAQVDLTKTIEGDVAWPEVYCRRAEIFNARQEYESTERDADQALALDNQYAPAWFYRGMARGNLEDHAAAEQDFLQARDLAPLWAWPHFCLGVANQLQENVAVAGEHFSRAIELDREYTAAWMKRGICRMLLQQPDLALEDLNRALELDPELTPALASRAQLWAGKSDFQRAAEDLTAALQLEPDDVSLLYDRARAWTQLREYHRACADFKHIIRLCPTWAAAYIGRGYAWTQIGQLAQADQDYREAILCDPQYAHRIESYQALAEAEFHHRHERYAKAIKCATAALAADASCRLTLILRAAAYWYDEEFVEAIDDYSKLLEIENDSFAYLSSRGQVYVEMKDYQAGLADLNRAIEVASESQTKIELAYARSGRALALAGLDRFEEARADFEASITDCPENAWVHYNHGRVYDKVGEHRKAALCFQLSLTLNDPGLTPRKRERARAYCEKHF